MQLIEKDEAVTRFFNEYPNADVQHIRALVRNARKEHEQAKPPKSFRELFQVIKEVIEGKSAAQQQEMPPEEDESDES